MPGFLIDLDGTMYQGTKPIPGAAEFAQRLNQQQIPFYYLTNNSSRTPEQVCAHMSQVGVEAKPEQVITTSQVAASYIQEYGKGNKVFYVGGEGLRVALIEAGLELTEENPDVVVQGLDRELHYDKLAKAVHFILNGANFISTNTDRLLPSEGGFQPGSGTITAAIQAAVQQEPVVIGKPSPIMMEYALQKIGLPKEEVWMVGDNIDTDIAGGHAVGCRTALVLTGVATKENADVWQEKAGVAADVVADDLDHLTRLIEGV